MTALIRADAARLPLAADSVDLVVTSPPFFAMRSYTDDGGAIAGQVGNEPTPDDFLEALFTVTAELVRVLKPSGSLFVNLGDKYAGSYGTGDNTALRGATWDPDAAPTRTGLRQYPKIVGIRPKSLVGIPWRYALGCVDRLGLILREEIIWSKPNGLPESVKDRCRRSHESFFHLTRGGAYFSALDEIRERHRRWWDPAAPNGGHTRERGAGLMLGRDDDPNGGINDTAPNPLGRLPGSVWTIATDPLIVPAWARDRFDLPDHFAAFPQELPRRFVLAFSPPGGVVLDPFAGTGTTVMVANTLDRYGIGVDLSAAYLRLARWRIDQSGHAAKTRTRTNLERQGTLFE